MSGVCVKASVHWYGGVVYQEFCRRQIYPVCVQDICWIDGDKVFYEYYQISRGVESDETETEPKKKGELRTKYESSHSPFGFIWQIASATGWTVDYILNKVNYQTLIMMLSDAPRYIKVREEKPAEDEANEILSFFQSRLSNEQTS